MSPMLVARRGTGQLHIVYPPEGGQYEALCGSTLAGTPKTKIVTWKANGSALKVWELWKHCDKCAHLDRVMRR